ncbi:MAG: METTL5 family protein [Methanobacteriaceae archaeon]|jgi:putative methylase|nr:METTL5 family protein [Candidatus Methanorudis spinitermitis]
MKISKKRHLEITIESIPKHFNPKVKWEQYSTSAKIAADLVWNANSLGDIFNKTILDLGCGTGVFTLSPLMIGAKIAVGIDIDKEAITTAENTAKNMKIANSHFFPYDVYDIKDITKDVLLKNNLVIGCDLKFDTVFTNPPFGSQYQSKKGADRIFMELAIKSADVSYSFHMAETRDFITDFYENLGGKITHEFFYNFPLNHNYDFHTKESKSIEVIVLRVENMGF